MYKLENWEVSILNPYQPPEAQERVLGGYVYGHPKHEDGSKIVTSRVIKSEGRVITTYSGSIYELGTVSSEYADYLKQINYALDETNPIKIKSVKDDSQSKYRTPSIFKKG